MANIPLVLVGNKNDENAGPREVAYATGETLQVPTCLVVSKLIDNNNNILHRKCGNVPTLRPRLKIIEISKPFLKKFLNLKLILSRHLLYTLDLTQHSTELIFVAVMFLI